MYSEVSSLYGPQETVSYNQKAVIVSGEYLCETKPSAVMNDSFRKENYLRNSIRIQ